MGWFKNAVSSVSSAVSNVQSLVKHDVSAVKSAGVKFGSSVVQLGTNYAKSTINFAALPLLTTANLAGLKHSQFVFDPAKFSGTGSKLFSSISKIEGAVVKVGAPLALTAIGATAVIDKFKSVQPSVQPESSPVMNPLGSAPVSSSVSNVNPLVGSKDQGSTDIFKAFFHILGLN